MLSAFRFRKLPEGRQPFPGSLHKKPVPLPVAAGEFPHVAVPGSAADIFREHRLQVLGIMAVREELRSRESV